MERDEKVVQLPAKVEKAPRPPHVIVLADVIDRLLSVPQVDSLIVGWCYPDGEGGGNVGFQTIGSTAHAHFLASRFCQLALAGQLGSRTLPTDGVPK